MVGILKNQPQCKNLKKLLIFFYNMYFVCGWRAGGGGVCALVNIINN